METILNRNSCLRQLSPARIWGNSIQKVARHFTWTLDTEKVSSIAEALAAHPEVMALGVCSDEGKALGIITRVNLFNLLGKPFGREILGKRFIHEILEFPGVFESDTNLFSIAEKIHPESGRMTVKHYLLRDAAGGFAGIFSSQDLLFYLSQITQMDIKLASSLQDRLVQESSSTKLGRGRIDAFSRYAQGVGGDFYHIKKVDAHRWFVTLCDVSGKGVAASIITSLIWGMLRMFDFSKGLKSLIRSVNEALIQTFHLEKHVTGVFLLIDEGKKEIVWADMGHSLAYIRRGKKVLPLQGAQSNLPVGLDPELTPHLYKTNYHPGDQILIFSDGLTEQVNAAGEEFSIEKVLTYFQDGKPELLDTLWGELTKHRGGIPLQDDTTALFLNLQ